MGFFSLTGETKSQHELSRPQVDVIKQMLALINNIFELTIISFSFFSKMINKGTVVDLVLNTNILFSFLF